MEQYEIFLLYSQSLKPKIFNGYLNLLSEYKLLTCSLDSKLRSASYGNFFAFPLDFSIQDKEVVQGIF